MEERLCYVVERPFCRAEQDETCEGRDHFYNFDYNFNLISFNLI